MRASRFKTFVFPVFFCLIFVLHFSTASLAAEAEVNEIQEAQAKQANETILNELALNSYKHHILPRYQKLVDDSAALNQVMIEFCKAPSADSLALARAAFEKTVLSFSAIEHVHFGPISQYYRMERLLYWPDHKGRGLRAVQRLLAKRDMKAISADKFSQKSVALQGLMALEYVLYKNGKSASALSLFTADEAGMFRCAYGMRLTEGLAKISKEIFAGWRDKSKLVSEFLKPQLTNEHYQKRSEVLLELYHSIVVEMKKIHDFKLKALYGTGGKKVNPKRAPFWRSGLSMRVIKTNIEAIDHFIAVNGFKSLLDKTPVDLQFHVSKRFEEIYALLKPYETGSVSIFDILQDANSVEDLKKISKLVSHLNVGFARYFALAANLPLGFNASDGD